MRRSRSSFLDDGVNGEEEQSSANVHTRVRRNRSRGEENRRSPARQSRVETVLRGVRVPPITTSRLRAIRHQQWDRKSELCCLSAMVAKRRIAQRIAYICSCCE